MIGKKRGPHMVQLPTGIPTRQNAPLTHVYNTSSNFLLLNLVLYFLSILFIYL